MSMKNESQTVTVTITVKYAWKLKNNTENNRCYARMVLFYEIFNRSSIRLHAISIKNKNKIWKLQTATRHREQKTYGRMSERNRSELNSMRGDATLAPNLQIGILICSAFPLDAFLVSFVLFCFVLRLLFLSGVAFWGRIMNNLPTGVELLWIHAYGKSILPNEYLWNQMQNVEINPALSNHLVDVEMNNCADWTAAPSLAS